MSITLISTVWKLKDLKTTERLVLVALADYVSERDWVSGVCWPSVKALMEKTSLSRAQVFRLLARLKTLGWIEWESRPGRNRVNRYFLKGLTRATVCVAEKVSSGAEKVSPMRLEKVSSTRLKGLTGETRNRKEPEEQQQERTGNGGAPAPTNPPPAAAPSPGFCSQMLTVAPGLDAGGIHAIMTACRAVAATVSEAEILFAARERMREATDIRRASGFLIRCLPDSFAGEGLRLIHDKMNAAAERERRLEREARQQEETEAALVKEREVRAAARERERAVQAEQEQVEREQREQHRRAQEKLDALPSAQRDQFLRAVETEILKIDPGFSRDGVRLREQRIEAEALRLLANEGRFPPASVVPISAAAGGPA